METLLFIIVSAIGSTLFRRYLEPHVLETIDFITKPDSTEVGPTESEAVEEQQFKYKIVNGYITIDFSRTQWPD